MKLLQSAQKTFTILGISSTKRPFNGKILMFVVLFVLWIGLYATFLLNIASTFEDYTENIYLTASTSIIFSCFMVIVFKMETVFEFLDGLEIFSNKSKSSIEI